MLQRLQRARLLWPTLLALAALAVLIGLGSWQLERKRWKEALIAKIAERVGAAPVPISATTATLPPGEDFDYLHVVATGRFLYDKERYLYAPSPLGLAWHVYTPLELGPGLVLWVNRGLVPDAWHATIGGAYRRLLSIDIEMRGLGDELTDYIAACMRRVVGVEVQLRVGEHPQFVEIGVGRAQHGGDHPVGEELGLVEADERRQQRQRDQHERGRSRQHQLAAIRDPAYVGLHDVLPNSPVGLTSSTAAAIR